MQLSELRTRVRYHLREATANTWADAELTSHINLAQRYIALRLDIKYLPQLIQSANLSFAASVNANLPTEYLKVAGEPFDFATGDVYPIIPPVDIGETRANYADSDSLFTSRKFSWIQDQDLFVPGSLTATIVFTYIKYPADLSADGDESTVEEGLVDLVILKAAADALIKTRQLQDSSLLLKALEQRIEILNRSK